MNNRVTRLAAAIALSAGVAGIAPATMAEVGVSANVGFVSDYYFRGINLGDAGVYGGVDVEASGFYAGTWIIDDSSGGNDGLETDFYAGYGMEMENGFSFGLGYNRYEYTYTSNYEDELVLSLGFSGFGFEYIDGTAHDEESSSSDDADYRGITLGWSGEVFGFTYGRIESDESGDDSSYDWVELSASGEIAGLSVSAILGNTTNVEDSAGDSAKSGDGYFFIDVSKSFDL